MVPVRIDPTRPDPPHRLNRTDRSIDRYRSTRSMLGFNACTIRASASPIEWNRCTDTHRSIAPISIDRTDIDRSHRYRSHRYRSGRTDTDRSIDRSIDRDRDRGHPGCPPDVDGWNARILDVDLNRAREDDAWANARAVDADARTRTRRHRRASSRRRRRPRGRAPRRVRRRTGEDATRRRDPVGRRG